MHDNPTYGSSFDSVMGNSSFASTCARRAELVAAPSVPDSPCQDKVPSKGCEPFPPVPSSTGRKYYFLGELHGPTNTGLNLRASALGRRLVL